MTHEAFFHNELKLADLMYMFMKVLQETLNEIFPTGCRDSSFYLFLLSLLCDTFAWLYWLGNKVSQPQLWSKSP